MRKKVTLFLILVLCVLLTLSLVACNNGQIDKLPDEIGAGDVNDNKNDGNINAYLKFSMPKAVSSIFSSIYADEFNMSDVEYSIVYTDNTSTTVVNGGNLSDAMVTKVVDNSTNQDVLKDLGSPIVWRKGHYMVFVSVTLSGGGKAEGSFALHLKDRYKETEQVTLTFDLNNDKATAFFGTFKGGKGTVKVDKGITLASWDDFTDAFRMVCEGQALSSVTYSGGTLSATSGFNGDGFTIDSDISFKANWTANVIKATLLLDKPNTTVQIGKSDPVLESAEGAKLATQSVVRGTGKIQAPVVDKFNVFNGYYFAGWYIDNDGNGKYSEGDTLWSFSQSVGSTDITLVARWTERSYTFTLYTMGGVYPQGVTSSLNIKSDNDVPTGYTLVNATSRFGLENHAINRIVVNDLAYGVDYSKYIVKVVVFESATDEQINANTRYFTFADLTAKLVKGSENYVANSGIYRDYQCTEPAKVDKIEPDETGKIDDIGYVKWAFKEVDGESDRARLERLSGYYTDVVFKDCLTIKSDGSIRIDKIADESVSELIIPATLIVGGKECPVTEISAKSCMNLKALLKIDMSKASNLTTIGEQAFAHCPALSEVIFPQNSAITELGKNVFYRSRFENEYKEKNNTDYFIVNEVLYKYVGTSVDANGEAVTSIDLTSLTQVKTIADGAFANRTEIKSVTLGDGVKRINNGAFAGCTDLDTFIVSENSQLEYIGETAFDGCAKLISTTSNVYANDGHTDYKAIIIGRVYYRFLDTTATSAIIPTNNTASIHVNHIAANAFKDCKNIATVTIDYPQEILSIGKDAFSMTEWIKTEDNFTKDGFSVVNGMLTIYYSGSLGVESDVVLPSNVRVINEHAFATFANQIATVQIGDGVKRIENYAFVGASSLVSLILHKVGVDTAQNKLTDAPEIAEYAFADKDGKLLDTVRFFFREEVINFLDAHKDGDDITDSATIGWIRLYKQYRLRFITEDIKAVWIANDAISHVVLRTDSNQSAVDTIKAEYGSIIAKALVVTGNTEVVRYEDLDITANTVSATLITKDNYPDLYEEGVNKYILTFTYDGSEKGCHNTPADGNAFIVTIVDAIGSSETSSFYETKIGKYPQNGTVIDANGKTQNDAFWFEGFEGDVDGELLPTFYTSNSGVNVTFVYRDVAGNIHRIPVKSIEGFSTIDEKPGEAKFTVDFHGIGTYVFSVDYNVKRSRYIAIEQVDAVAIPINGEPLNYFRNFNVNMVGQDGSISQKPLSTLQGFEVIEVDGVKTSKVNTATLGLHTLKIAYNRTDAANELTQTITYSVVLEADASLFTYEVIDYAAKTARITGCLASAKSMETIVLPSTYTENGVVYAVTDIGNIQSERGVFEDYTKLKAVYLGRNIVKIGTNSFRGCTALEHVYTAQRVDDDAVALHDYNFDVISTEETENDTIKYVSVGNLQGVEYSGVLVIGAQYVTEATEGTKRIVYKVVGIGEGVTVNAGTEVFLPDTVYRFSAIKYVSAVEGEEGAAVVPYVYTSANGIKFKTVEYVSESVEYIGNSAFSGCSSLKSIDLTRATKLNYIGANAFENCGLESIDLSKNTLLKSIDAKVFNGCTSLSTVMVSSSLKYIGDRAFGGCTNLLNFTFSDVNGLETVVETAFEGCTKDGFVAPTKA